MGKKKKRAVAFQSGMPQPAESRFIFPFSILFVSFLFGLGMALRLYEDDFYWQLRAGEEILRGHFSFMESWSYSVRGDPWYNYEWFSCLIFRVITALGGAGACVLLRVVLVNALFWILGSMIPILCKGFARWVALLLLMPALYVALMFRLELRPEFFGLLILAGWLRLWLSRRSLKVKLFVTPLCIFLWANLHGGTAIFGAFVMGALPLPLLKQWKHKLVWTFLTGAAFFLTPFHFRIIPILLEHFTYVQTIFNTEWQAVTLAHFNVFAHGASIAVWLCLSVFGWIAWVAKANRAAHLSIYGNRILATLIAVVLTALSFYRIRMIPYQLLFFFPLMLAGIQNNYRRSGGKTLLLVGLLWCVILPYQEWRLAGRFGFQVDDEKNPVRVMDYVKKNHPKGNIFSGFTVGGYQLWALPEYPDFVDPRDTIFNRVKGEYGSALQNPQAFRELTQKYGINTVIWFNPTPPLEAPARGVDLVQATFPPLEWGLTYFDNRQMVFLRRIPENQRILDRDEFQYLRPSIYPSSYLSFRVRTQWELTRLLEEVRICRSREPRNVYCSAVNFLLGQDKSPEVLDQAAKFAREANPQLLRYLRPCYQQAGDTDAVQRIDSELASLAKAGMGFWSY